MVINSNMSALYASRIEGINTQSLQKSMEKLSSGEKINRAGDDSAGLAVSEKMRSQIRGLNKASENAQNAVSFIQTTEGYLQETTDVLQRIRELAVQSSNGIYSDEDRMQIQVEVSQLVSEVDRIANSAEFNGFKMLTGRYSKEDGSLMSFHIGANIDQNIQINIESATASKLGLINEGQEGSETKLSIADPDSANLAIGTVDEALKNINKQRADLGAVQNRMEMAVKGLNVASENLVASESRIRDTDFAKEMVNYTKNQILSQTSVAMLSQSQISSQAVLKLLD